MFGAGQRSAIRKKDLAMTYTPPRWAALAKSALIRMRSEHTAPPDDPRADGRQPWQPVERPERKMSQGTSDLLDGLAASPTATQIPLAEQDAVRAAGGDPLAVDGQGRDRPTVHVPTSELSLMLRLCATIGTQARLKDILAPGALTVIEIGPNTGGMSPTDVRHMLEVTLLPEEVEVLTVSRPGAAKGAPELCVVELVAEDPDRIHLKEAARQRLLRGLESPHPVLILAETLSQLSDNIRRALPGPIRLAPLSRDIIMALISATCSATGKIDPVLFHALPEDGVLARLSDASLAMALRGATPNGVAARLSDLTRQTADGGPTLDDIEGYGEAETAARRMVEDLKNWSEGRIAWSEVQRSVLLFGPPGTGKSYLARAMANSAGVTLVRGSFATWQSKGTLSHMLRAMRASFDAAAAARPAILVIDEIDAVGDRADPDPHNGSYRQQVINGFLEALDTLKYIEGVMIVGTTNYPDRIDAAVLRPGRIDIKAQVPLPGAKALARMICDGVGSEVSSEEMSRLTRAATGQSAADVDGALRQARSVARAEGREVTSLDVLTALRPDAESHNPALDYRIAIHECGHAIVGTDLRLGTITRVMLTQQGGQAWITFASSEQLLADLEAELAYSLAGRAAERLIFGKAAAGAGGNALSDLAHATQTATAIDTRMGLGAEGPVWLDIPPAVYLRNPENAARVRARLEASESRAMRILETRRDVLTWMAADLVALGALEGEKLAPWLARVSLDPGSEGLHTARKNVSAAIGHDRIEPEV